MSGYFLNEWLFPQNVELFFFFFSYTQYVLMRKVCLQLMLWGSLADTQRKAGVKI